MVQGKWFPMGSDLQEPLSVRKEVFGIGEEGEDAQAWQVVVYDDQDRPAGCARLRWAEGAFLVERLGVREEKRLQGFGDLLIRLCLFKALTHAARVIRLVPTPETAAFFAKYGFSSEGEGMSIQGEDVCLSHCGGRCADCAKENCPTRENG